jgi:hypothetical protein
MNFMVGGNGSMHAEEEEEEEEERLNSLPACLHSNPFCSFNKSNKKTKDFNIWLLLTCCRL